MVTFDKNKGNLGSFIFSICRNEITKYQYRNKKIRKELSSSGLSEHDKTFNYSKVVVLNVDEEIYLNQQLNEFDTLKFSSDFICDFSQGIVEYPLLNKVLLWKKLI